MSSVFFGKNSEGAEVGGKQAETAAPNVPLQNRQDINWDKWSPPGEGDVRSPCPAINALANHGILPHNGKGITKAMAVEALMGAFNVDAKIANIFSSVAVAANPDHSAHSFDLNHVSKHGYIEHDGSLSRDDAAFGGGEKFDQEAFDVVLSAYREAHAGEADDAITTDWVTAGHARYARIMASKAKHEKAQATWVYGIKEAIMSYGETSLYLNLLGKDGVAPLQWVKIFFEQGRLPYAEGWRPPTTIDQSGLNHGYSEMMKNSEHGNEEVRLIGIGTLVALKEAILSLGSGMIKSPSWRG